jgi:hypothetical protein
MIRLLGKQSFREPSCRVGSLWKPYDFNMADVANSSHTKLVRIDCGFVGILHRLGLVGTVFYWSWSRSNPLFIFSQTESSTGLLRFLTVEYCDMIGQHRGIHFVLSQTELPRCY